MSAHYAMCRYDDATGSYIPLEVRPIGCGKDWRLEMTTHDRDKVIAAAKEAGFAEWENTDSPEFLALIAEFYTIAFEAGRVAGVEEAAVIADTRITIRG